MSPELVQLLWEATQETLWMVSIATVIAVALGIPLGVELERTSATGLAPRRAEHAVLDAVVNIGRSLPFIILLVLVAPLTREIVGTTIGPSAAIVPLALGAIPFYARLVETSLREVHRGKIEAAVAFGATPAKIVRSVLLPEALPSLISGATVTFVTLIGYSAMAGAIGGGGLGDVAIRYGYQRFDTQVTLATVVVLVILTQFFQILGDRVARATSHA